MRRDHTVATPQVAFDVAALGRGQVGGTVKQDVGDRDVHDWLPGSGAQRQCPFSLADSGAQQRFWPGHPAWSCPGRGASRRRTGG